jgi:hypothetical protein
MKSAALMYSCDGSNRTHHHTHQHGPHKWVGWWGCCWGGGSWGFWVGVLVGKGEGLQRVGGVVAAGGGCEPLAL